MIAQLLLRINYFGGFLLIMALGLFQSCATSSVTINVLRPADISVPTTIERLVVANRSLPAEDKKVENVVEGFLTGEGLWVDRFGSRECVLGLQEGLDNYPRYKAIEQSTNDLPGTGTGEFPLPMDWEKVGQICKQHNMDALVVLEVFDSDNKYGYSKEERTRKEEERTIRYQVHIAELGVSVKSGWRIYDPFRKIIIDANTYNDYKQWTTEGKTKNEARSKLPDLSDAVKMAGFYAGKQYALRISPSWVNVSRVYFKMGNDDMKRAKRYVKITSIRKLIF